MIRIQNQLTPKSIRSKIIRLFELSDEKLVSLRKTSAVIKGSPVFTTRGQYGVRGWTEWTEGFVYGSSLLQFDATGDREFLDYGRDQTLGRMANHVTHMGVHDHGFNNVSTYGNLLRFIKEGLIPFQIREKQMYELALKCSGAVQASRWTEIKDDLGYIYSFNGPHSLFSDTVRSLRSLALAHHLGHVLMGENDVKISLLKRLIQHAVATARFNVYYGEGRDAYDVHGRVVHESVFNVNDGAYRCPSTQQGYSPFSTWTRGLAWILCGFAEQLEFLDALSGSELSPFGGRQKIANIYLRAAEATAEFYIESSPTDGIPYWDTGAPNLYRIKNHQNKPSDPFNSYEPVDSSAAAIAAQGLWRLGRYLTQHGKRTAGSRYQKTALTVANHLFDRPYLSENPRHQGLILHSVYHRPNGWDHIPKGKRVPCGESSMWGDYHARELALLLLREIQQKTYLTFFNI